MPILPPLRFRPILRDYLWGGQRLATEFGKPLGPSKRAAESWEIVDHAADQSLVSTGPLAGRTLHELVCNYGLALLGQQAAPEQFPLLFKLLDCQRTLSVQVHPNDTQAALLSPPDLGKTEAWVVLAAEPGSKIYAGLRPGIDRATLEHAVANGTCADCLHAFEPQVGECLLIEAGTLHALGEGLLVAEIQQASDTTYRLFDWNRLDADGKPRALHVEQALDTIDFSRGPVNPTQPTATTTPGVVRLATCEKFVVDRRTAGSTQQLPPDDRFHILAVIEGQATIRAAEETYAVRRGETLLLPAERAATELLLSDEAVVLDMYLPE